jgi:hypothetical protein
MTGARIWTANGTPGYSISDLIANFNTMVVPYDPDTIIVAIGRNQNGSLATGTLTTQYIGMLQAFKPSMKILWVTTAIWTGEQWAAGPPLVWNNTFGDSELDLDNSLMSAACAAASIPYVDTRAPMLIQEQIWNTGNAFDGVLSVDGTHGTARGYYLMSQSVAPFVP